MTSPQPPRSARGGRLAVLTCLGLGLLAAPAVLAQSGSGAAGGREIAPTGATVPGASARGTGDTARERVQDRLRETDRARPAEHDREQLRDLNALSRELAPGVPPPAPGVEDGAARGSTR